MVAEAETALGSAFNAGLETLLRDVEREHGVTIRRLDVHDPKERAAADPAAFGFDDVLRPCVESDHGCDEPQRHLFWDGIHPTAIAHARLAQELLRVLEKSSVAP